jgi:hypothetical protein
MKEFKKGDKVTIKDIEGVIRSDFDNQQNPFKLDRFCGEGTYQSLLYLKKYYGVVDSNFLIRITGFRYAWKISNIFLLPYNDVSLDDNLFKI